MKTKEIKDKDDSALQKELVEKKRHLFDLRSQAVTDKLTDPTQLGKTKRDIARIMTVMHQRKLTSTVTTAATPATK